MFDVIFITLPTASFLTIEPAVSKIPSEALVEKMRGSIKFRDGPK